MNAGAGERTLHPLKGALVDLRNAAFIDSQDSANFFHCQITIVIQRNDLLIALRKRLHSGVEPFAHFRAGEDLIRTISRATGCII